MCIDFLFTSIYLDMSASVVLCAVGLFQVRLIIIIWTFFYLKRKGALVKQD